MFSDLGTLRAKLRALLASQLPEQWQIVPNLEAAREALVPVIYIEFTGFDSTAGGQPLPRTQLAANIDLVVTSMSTNDGQAEDEADNYVMWLLRAIVPSDDLFFSTARKIRLDAGPLAWRVSITAITDIALAEIPEGE